MHKRTGAQLRTALALVDRCVDGGHVEQPAGARERVRALATRFGSKCELAALALVHVHRDSVRERERESVPVDEQRGERRGVEPLDGSGRGPGPCPDSAPTSTHSMRGVHDRRSTRRARSDRLPLRPIGIVALQVE